MKLSREFFEQVEENGNVVHEVCRAQMTCFDYNGDRYVRADLVH